ncbi:9085_t:CDS:1, partial [Racocetra persica]
SSIRKKRKISDKNIEKAIVKKIKQNNCKYTTEFVSMATKLSTIGQISISSTVQCTKEIITFLTGQPSRSCLSPSTLSRWTKEVAEISIQDNIPQFLNRFSSYGILADESTRGEKKIFLVCIAYWNENKQEPMLTILNMKDLDRCSAST